MSVVFALGASLSLYFCGESGPANLRGTLLIVAAACIQLRLLSNLLDGMVAIEGGHKTPTGELYNEFPDRIADVLILVGVGYGIVGYAQASLLAWIAASLALTTAYVRALGAASGTPNFFEGPMAKPHRMAVITVACLGSLIETGYEYQGHVLFWALVLIVGGSLVTVFRRLLKISGALRDRS